MARARLRRIGLSDQYIEGLTTRRAISELLVAEVLADMAQDDQREQEWLARAAGEAHLVRITSMGELAKDLVTADSLTEL